MQRRLFLFISLFVLFGCAKQKVINVSFHLESDQIKLETFKKKLKGKKEQDFIFEKKILLDNSHIRYVQVLKNSSNSYDIVLHLTDQASKRLSSISKKHIGKRLGIIIDGTLIMAPIILSPLVTPSILVKGNFTRSKAAELANGIVN